MATTMTVFVGKLGETIDVQVADGSMDYLRQYGLNQSVNDAHASVLEKSFAGDTAKFHAAVREKVQARITQIESGNVPNLRGPAAISDTAAIAHLAKSMGLTPDAVLAAIERQKKRPAA